MWFCSNIWSHSQLCLCRSICSHSRWFYAATPGFIPGSVYVGVSDLFHGCVSWEHLVLLSMCSCRNIRSHSRLCFCTSIWSHSWLCWNRSTWSHFWVCLLKRIWSHPRLWFLVASGLTHGCVYLRYKRSNTGKRARRKNLRHKRERFLGSIEAPPSWRPIEIFPACVWDFSILPSYRCLIFFLTNFPILYVFWCLILFLTKHLCFVYIPSSVFPQNCFPLVKLIVDVSIYIRVLEVF